jgi:hypothetical protein
VEPFPGPGAKVAATIVGEGTPQVSSRQVLFSTAPYKTTVTDAREYHVAPDGRFLMQRIPSGSGEGEEAVLPNITIVLSWFEEIRERVPVPLS